MGIATVSFIISACVDVSLGIAALMRNFRSRLCIAFGAVSGLLFVYDALGVVNSFDAQLETSSIRSLVALLLGPTCLGLLGEIVPAFRNNARRWWMVYIPVLLGALVWIGVWRWGVSLWMLWYLSQCLLLVPAMVWTLRLRLAERESLVVREKARFRQLMWGACIVLLLYLTDLFALIGFGNSALGTIGRTLYLLFVFQVFVQKEIMTAEEVVAKTALFGGVAIILATFYFLLVSWVGDRPGLFFFNTLIASFGIIVLFDPIRNFTSRLTRSLFLKRHNALERELGLLSSDLMGIVDGAELSLRLAQSLKRSLGITNASLFLARSDDLSLFEVGSAPREVAASDPLVEYMMLRRGRPFVLETVENDRESFHSSQPIKFCDLVLESMRGLGVDFIIPFIQDSRLVGFTAAALSERILLTNDELRLFLPVSRQIAVILKNAQAFQHAANREKLAAVGELAAGLAHEIKNPLGAIRGAAELLKDPSQESSEFVKIILDETDRLTNVVTSVLDFAKPSKSVLPACCEPLKVIEHTVKLFSQDAKIDVDAQQGVAVLSVDPESLKQVLVNLFLNAVQAMDKTTARIGVRLREIHPVPFSFLRGSLPMYKLWDGWRPESRRETRSFVEIEVSDNGPGIPAVELPRVFAPFHTTKTKGTGLGLAICNRLIDSMGGTIQVRSTVGEGTRFIIHLPIDRTHRPVTKESHEHLYPSGG